MSRGEAVGTDTERVLAEQIQYYRWMATTGQFDRAYARTGRYDRGGDHARQWQAELADVQRALVEADLRGDVLELACGHGRWTAVLADGPARSITAADASAEMLALNRKRLGDGTRVRHVQADLFTWRPERQFDAIAFGLWLSHVPPELFERFWALIHEWLAPGGRVFFFDSSYAPDRCAADEALGAPTDTMTTRRLDDGREFQIVKIFHQPDELARRLRELGWEFDIRGTGRYFYVATGHRAPRTTPDGDPSG